MLCTTSELAGHTYSRQHHILTDSNVFFSFSFLSRSEGHWIIWFDKTLRVKKSTGCSTVGLELCSVSDLWGLVQKTTLFTFWRLPFKWPRQLSLSASAFSAQRAHSGKHLPTHHRPPLHLRGAGQPETPSPGTLAQAVAPPSPSSGSVLRSC